MSFASRSKQKISTSTLPILVEIVQEGKWRTDALKPREWLRKNLVRRVKRSGAPEDYDPTGKRRPGGPKFDKRNGALTAFATRPYAEFEVLSRDGEPISPDEAIEGQVERKRLRTALRDEDDNSVVMPADRDSLRFLGRRSYAEKCEGFYCSQIVYALKHDRPIFDQELARAIANQQALAKRLGLCDPSFDRIATPVDTEIAGTPRVRPGRLQGTEHSIHPRCRLWHRRSLISSTRR